MAPVPPSRAQSFVYPLSGLGSGFGALCLSFASAGNRAAFWEGEPGGFGADRALCRAIRLTDGSDLCFENAGDSGEIVGGRRIAGKCAAHP